MKSSLCVPGLGRGSWPLLLLLLKEMIDRVGAVAIMLMLSPLLLALAAAIRLTSPGPVLYWQNRYGKNKKVFRIYKFRSMYVDQCDAPASAVNHSAKGDPRVTPLGRRLRRMGLDELPQLFNILQGNMSLIGPRPHAIARDDYFSNLIENYDARFRMKPGISGLAQVQGLRGEILDTEFMRRRIAADNMYIDRWSLLLDARIMMRTLLIIFHEEQAY